MATKAVPVRPVPANDAEPRPQNGSSLTVVQPAPTPSFVGAQPLQHQVVPDFDLVIMAQQQSEGSDWRDVYAELRVQHDLTGYAADRFAFFHDVRLRALARGEVQTDPEKGDYIDPVHWAIIEARKEELARRGLKGEDYRQIAGFTDAINQVARLRHP